MPKITITDGGTQSVYELFDDQHEVSIGRGAANALQVRDSHASKHHAAIRQVQGRWKLIDLESKNGIRVNGAFRNQHWLNDGDVLSIGAAEMRYEGPAAAPVVPPPPAAAPTVFAEEAIDLSTPAPAAPAPAAAPAAAPAFAPAPSTASRAGPSRRRRERDDYDDEEGEERPTRRRGDSNSAVIVLLMGLGAVAFIGLMFLLFSVDGEVNVDVRVAASKLANAGKLEQAIKYAQQHGQPSEAHWEALKEELDSWKSQVANIPIQKRNAEGRNWFDTNILRRTRTSMFRAKDALSPSEAAEVLREFLSAYGDTSRARELLFSKTPPYPEYREFMKDNLGKSEDANIAFGILTREITTMTNRKRFGDAVRRLEFEKAKSQLLMPRETAQTFRRMVDNSVVEVKQAARRSFDEEMAQVDGLARRGETRKALRQLQTMIDTYGMPAMVKEAQDKYDEVR